MCSKNVKKTEGQLVGGQKTERDTHGCKSEEEGGKNRGDRNTARQKHSNSERQRRETDRQTDAAGQKQQAKAPVESACQQSCNCHLVVESPHGGREGKECGSDKIVKDRGRTWGVACLAGLESVWVERIQGYHCTEAFTCTNTHRKTYFYLLYFPPVLSVCQNINNASLSLTEMRRLMWHVQNPRWYWPKLTSS